MKSFYDDRLNAADAISTLADNVKGKYLMEKGCVKLYYAGRPFCEGDNAISSGRTWAIGK